MHALIRKARWSIGTVWSLSWFELYLEIFRHHHVTQSLLLSPMSWWGGASGQPRPGTWLLTVLTCSALAPPLFAVLVVARRSAFGEGDRSRDGERREPGFPFARTSAVVGAMLCVVATLNQVIRHPPIEFDLTLRTGNGGFIVLGALLLAAPAVSRLTAVRSQSLRNRA
jgi:hypothetical protein